MNTFRYRVSAVLTRSKRKLHEHVASVGRLCIGEHTVHAGRRRGYLEGRVSALEDIMAILDEMNLGAVAEELIRVIG